MSLSVNFMKKIHSVQRNEVVEVTSLHLLCSIDFSGKCNCRDDINYLRLVNGRRQVEITDIALTELVVLN